MRRGGALSSTRRYCLNAANFQLDFIAIDFGAKGAGMIARANSSIKANIDDDFLFFNVHDTSPLLKAPFNPLSIIYARSMGKSLSAEECFAKASTGGWNVGKM